MAFDYPAAKKAGYNDEEINSYLNPVQKSFTQNASSGLRSLGLGVLPDAAAAITGAFQGGIKPNNPFITTDEFKNIKQQGQTNTLKDAAGAASWMIPETKIAQGGNLLTHILSGVLNRGVQGAAQGGLYATSQGQDPVTGAEIGATANPILAGAGNILTDPLPRYIGLRNYGPAGLQLPEVINAENAAGNQSLKDVRNQSMDQLKPFTLNAPEGDPQNRQDLITKIKDLANLPEWKGTEGLSDLKKSGKGSLPQQTGALTDITKLIQNSNDPFDAYSQIKNRAYPQDNTPAANRLAAFYHSAAHTAREHLINSTDNPDVTRQIMDNYANQTAMNKSGSQGNLLSNMIGEAAKGGPSADLGLAGLASILPALHGLAGFPLADYAVTNPITGPHLAKGLVNAGQKTQNTGIADILRKLGVIGAQGAINSQ